MSGRDRIERLEALSRLRKEGVLDDEFAREKRRILDEDIGDGAVDSRTWRKPVLAIVAVLALAGSAWFANGLATPEASPERDAVAQVAGADASSSRGDTAALPASPAPTPSPTADPAVLDDAIAFASPSQCIAGDTLQRIYAKLDRAREGGVPQNVKLDAFARPLNVSARSGKDAEGGWSGTAALRLPEATTWHGLRISRITAAWTRPPETDSVYDRSITFLEPPARVVGTLNRLGFKAVVAPGYSELPDTYNSCGGAMNVEARPGGSALSCGWGC